MSTLRESLSYEPVVLTFGTSGLRDLVRDMTDLECYANTAGFLQFLTKEEGLTKDTPIMLAGDLRDSTPRIMRALYRAITDNGFTCEYQGLVPTPAVAYEGWLRSAPSIMVTGSHIPSDRNGIKFHKTHDELLKQDEAPINAHISAERQRLYDEDAGSSIFNAEGMLRESPELPAEKTGAVQHFMDRYRSVFAADCLKGKKIVFYQHSAVGRDLLVDIFRALGADVVPVERSDVFIPIDSENVTPKQLEHFKEMAAAHPGLFAIVSTDGDSDRPFMVDETGTFHRGDVLGAVVAKWLKADAAAYPVSASDAADDYLQAHNIPFAHTKIGSPYVISAMHDAAAAGKNQVVGWEVNGGFLHYSDLHVGGGVLKPLPTRDAFLPLLVALLAGIERGSISALFKELPERFTSSGLINDFPYPVYRKFIERYGQNTPETYAQLSAFYTSDKGFGNVTKVDSLDGVRVYFDNGDIAHLRESGNAPQLRIYAIANTQERANEIAALAIADDGIFRQMEAANQN